MEDRGALKAVGPVSTAPLFPGLHAELMALLRGLAPADWDRLTTAAPWTVRDVALHLLDGDIRRLSFHRDAIPPPPPDAPIDDHRGLVAYLDRLNGDWVRVARRIGPPLLVDFLAVTGPQLSAFVAGLDPHGQAFYPVGWAGETQSEHWLDVAREYTERWHHQQQIREAVGAPALVAPQWLRPVLQVSMRALPHTYRHTPAAEGRAVAVVIRGEAGGAWTLLRAGGAWRLFDGSAAAPAARVTLDEGTGWRLFFGVPMSDARARVAIEGDEALGAVVLKVIAIMA